MHHETGNAPETPKQRKYNLPDLTKKQLKITRELRALVGDDDEKKFTSEEEVRFNQLIAEVTSWYKGESKKIEDKRLKKPHTIRRAA